MSGLAWRASRPQVAGGPEMRGDMRIEALLVPVGLVLHAMLIYQRVFTAEGIRILASPPQAPRANAICERLVGTLRRELLDRVLIINEHHLRRALAEYLRHYNAARPHRSLGQLTPTAQGGQGGGAVLQLVSPRLIDFSIVIVNGLDPNGSARLPYRVQLVNPQGRILRAGKITALDDEGGADVYHQFDTQDLTGFTSVQVVDANGTVVLRGTVDQEA